MSDQANSPAGNDDIRSALLATVGEIEQRDPGSTGELAQVVPKTADPSPSAKPEDTQLEKPAASGDRDDKGRFVPKAKDDAVEPSKETAPVKETSTLSAEPKADAPKADEAPGTWKPEERLAWKGLPATAKAAILRRESEFGKAGAQRAQENQQLKAQLDEIDTVIGPRKAAWQATQGGVSNALKQLLAYSDFAGSDPAGFIAEFSQRMGVDLNGLMNSGHSAPQVAPEYAQLQQTINGLQQRLQQFEVQNQQVQVSTLKSEFDAFENERSDDGEPKHPFYSDVRDSKHLLPEIHLVKQEHPDWSPRQVIAEAYDRTVYKLSDVRTRMQTYTEQRAAQVKEKADRALAASNARKSVTGGPPSPGFNGNAASPNASLRDEIAAVYHSVANGDSKRL